MDNFLEAYFGNESDVEYIKENVNIDKNKYHDKIRFTSEFKIFEVKSNGTKKYLNLSFFGFVKYLKLNLVGGFSFQALNPQDLSNGNISKDISKIVKKINSL